MIPLSVPSFSGKEREYLLEALDSGWVSSVGPHVNKFEESIASYLGIQGGVACSSGTAALHTAARNVGVTCGTLVIVPSVTFIATINAIQYQGATPLFFDCDSYLNLDGEQVLKFLRTNCKVKNGKPSFNDTEISAIVIVHVLGHAVDREPFFQIKKEFNIPIIEDAAESLGTYYKDDGAFTGTCFDIGCLSFNGNKIITTGGGGMILSKDRAVLERARYLTTQARDDGVQFIHNEVGYNYRLSNLQASLGLGQMEKLEAEIEARQRVYQKYESALPVLKPPAYSRNNHWLSAVCFEKPIDLLQVVKELKEKGIETRPLWQLNHLQKPYSSAPRADSLANSERFIERILTLPSGSFLSEDDIEKVIISVRSLI